jgi:hypothetical protein
VDAREETSVIGYALWALLLVAALTLEALGLTVSGRQWPTVSDLFRSGTRPVYGRWIVFALWLWAGWHFFIRGWEFFLRGKGAEAPGAAGGKTFGATITQVLIPLFLLFAVFFTVGWASKRLNDEDLPARSASNAAARRPRQFVRYAFITTIAGYVLLVAAIGVYQLIAGSSAAGDLRSAAKYGAFLAFAVALPLFLVIAFVFEPIVRRARSARGDRAVS